MARSKEIPLRRLLKRDQVSPLLQDCEALMPGANLALIGIDGRFVSGSGEHLGELLLQRLSGMASEQMIKVEEAYLCPLLLESTPIGALVAHGPVNERALNFLHRSLTLLVAQAMEKRSLAHETLGRYREINLLYNIGETIGACLESEEIPELMLREASGVIQADVGLVLLPLSANISNWEVKASFGSIADRNTLYRAFQATVSAADSTDRPAIISELPANAAPLSSILYAPLKTQDRVLGSVLLGRSGARPVFIAEDEKLLMALAGQAAVAVENASLFADLKRQRDAIAEMKNYMDNIFASIASGVITTDIQDKVITLNQAAEHILEIQADEAIGQLYVIGLPGFGDEIVPLVNTVRRQDEQITGYELHPNLPARKNVVLRLHISPLKDSQQSTTGVAIVLDDLTERRQLELQIQQVRATFERYVVPRVVAQLLSDPASVRLGGVRRELTVLFADIRNFSVYSQKSTPEHLVQVLNQHLTLAAEAILAEEGTLDKFMGDATMALFNTPLPQSNHALRAVRAALAMQKAISDLHADIPQDNRLSFGIGITTGMAVAGNIGSTTIRNYTAIGDSVNMASRLQAYAQPGQVLLNHMAYEQVCDQVVGRELGLVQLKGHPEPDLIFEVTGLKQ
ncbi:MAG: GAF domain-containing protein [Anaerolineae bacterium]|nr:GAF domain-containing protein [Anaerolineae bacterium]